MKNLKKLGKTLNRQEQKTINGGELTITPTGCGNRTCGVGCASNQECVEIFCGPGPNDVISSEFQCISIVNHK
ncbi:hypothetical protein D1817_08070 [Flavobacteriaceae bacterium]|nr:hypothetical protein D1817_08070 [Flavobacteriaceae bacterium]